MTTLKSESKETLEGVIVTPNQTREAQIEKSKSICSYLYCQINPSASTKQTKLGIRVEKTKNMSATQFMGTATSPNAGPHTGAFSGVSGGAGMPNLSLGGGLGLYGGLGRPSFPGSVGGIGGLYPGGLGSLSSMGFNGQQAGMMANNAALLQASAAVNQGNALPPAAASLQPVDADIVVAPGTEHANRVANLEYQSLLKYNAFLYACLPERQQKIMVTNIHEFLTMVRGRRIIHRNVAGAYFLGSAVEGPFMISQEISSEPCRLAAHFEHPTWVLDGLVTKEDKKNLWVRRDPKEPFNKAWKKLSGPELKATLKDEGFANLLHLPTGVTITKVEGSVVETVGKKPGKKRGPKPKDKSTAAAAAPTVDEAPKEKEETASTEATKHQTKAATPNEKEGDTTTTAESDKKPKGRKKSVAKMSTESEKTTAKDKTAKASDETPKKTSSPKKAGAGDKPKRGAKRTSEATETTPPAKRGRKKKEESAKETSTAKKKSPVKAEKKVVAKAKGNATAKTTSKAKQAAKSKKESPAKKSTAAKTKVKSPPSTGRRSKRTRV
jgi:hypothetical protein